MARKRRSRRPVEISLFPFLSVLSGVIGALALIITGMLFVGVQDTDQVIDLVERPTGKEPVYVECQRDGLVLHPEGTVVALDSMEDPSGPWTRCLHTISEQEDERYLLLLIRPDGVDCFDRALAMARKRKIDVGFDPVYNAGPIRFRTEKTKTTDTANTTDTTTRTRTTAMTRSKEARP